MSPPGLGCTNCGELWCDRAVTASAVGWKWTRHTWADWRRGFAVAGRKQRLWWLWLARKRGRVSDASDCVGSGMPRLPACKPSSPEAIQPGSTVHTDGWEGY